MAMYQETQVRDLRRDQTARRPARSNRLHASIATATFGRERMPSPWFRSSSYTLTRTRLIHGRATTGGDLPIAPGRVPRSRLEPGVALGRN